jgi:hypothetical protein
MAIARFGKKPAAGAFQAVGEQVLVQIAGEDARTPGPINQQRRLGGALYTRGGISGSMPREERAISPDERCR